MANPILKLAYARGYSSILFDVRNGTKYPLQESEYRNEADHERNKGSLLDGFRFPFESKGEMVDKSKPVLVCIDCDYHISSREAKDLLEVFKDCDVVLEESYSGNLHIFLEVDMEPDEDYRVRQHDFHKGKIEVYYKNRNLLTTGKILPKEVKGERSNNTPTFRDFFSELRHRSFEGESSNHRVVIADHRRTLEEVSIVRCLLSFIPAQADGYEDWARVGRAIHEMLGAEQGLPVFDDWSAQSTEYNPASVRKEFFNDGWVYITGMDLIHRVEKTGNPAAKAYLYSLGEYRGDGKFVKTDASSYFESEITAKRLNFLPASEGFVNTLKKMSVNEMFSYQETEKKLIKHMNEDFCWVEDVLIHKYKKSFSADKAFSGAYGYLEGIPYRSKDKNGDICIKTFDGRRLWAKHPDCDRRHGRLVLLPEQEGEAQDYNTWSKYEIDWLRESNPEVVPCSRYPAMFREYILNGLCSGDKKAADYLINLLAFCRQKPHIKPQVGIQIRSSDRGSGKSLLTEILRDYVGDTHFCKAKRTTVEGNHNEELATSKINVFDEVVFSGDKKTCNMIKDMITSSTIQINPKNRKAYSIESYALFIFLTNNEVIMETVKNDRRFLQLDNSRSKYIQDFNFFSKVAVRDFYTKELNLERLFALDDLLLNRDLSRFRVTDVPVTKATEDQIELSMHPLEEFLLEGIERFKTGSPDDVSTSMFDWGDKGRIKVNRDILEEEYNHWVRNNCVGRNNLLSKRKMGKIIQNFNRWNVLPGKLQMSDGSRINCWVLEDYISEKK